VPNPVRDHLTGVGELSLHRILLPLTVILMAAPAAPNDDNVVRATLDNGLRVVIVRDPLAPVVTVETNYIVGGDETPAGFPGMAHAQEHMAFRGCAGLSADQIAAIYAQLGGNQNADTQQNITQYFVTVPAQDLEVALHVDSSCMADVEDSDEQWAEERGAIEQEVSRDLSNPTYKFIARLNEDLFAGRPMHTMRWAPELPLKRPQERCSGSFIRIGMRPTMRSS
jgi:zinc protease